MSELGSANSSQSLVTSAATNWGEAVEGFQVRLRSDQARWRTNETPTFHLDVRNLGRWRFESSTNDHLWRVQVDGVWYRGANDSGAIPELLPDQLWTNLPVVLTKAWRTAHSNEISTAAYGGAGTWIPSEFSRQPLQLTPGKHTVRLAVFGLPARAGTVGPVKAISNPVEVEITAQDDSSSNRHEEAPPQSTKSQTQSMDY